MGVFCVLKCRACGRVLEGAAMTGEALYMNIRRSGYAFDQDGRSNCSKCNRPRPRRKTGRGGQWR